jgi:hypothetical protein
VLRKLVPKRLTHAFPSATSSRQAFIDERAVLHGCSRYLPARGGYKRKYVPRRTRPCELGTCHAKPARGDRLFRATSNDRPYRDTRINWSTLWFAALAAVCSCFRDVQENTMPAKAGARFGLKRLGAASASRPLRRYT